MVLAALYLLIENNRVRWDMSEDSQNTLAVETMEKLRLIDLDGQPVQITAFSFKRGEPDSPEKDRAVKELLQEIGIHSDMISWEHVDYDKEKVTAEQLSVQEYGHVVCKWARSEWISNLASCFVEKVEELINDWHSSGKKLWGEVYRS